MNTTQGYLSVTDQQLGDAVRSLDSQATPRSPVRHSTKEDDGERIRFLMDESRRLKGDYSLILLEETSAPSAETEILGKQLLEITGPFTGVTE